MGVPSGGDRGRVFEYDLVRCVAMLFVIAVHALACVDVSWGPANYYVVFGQTVFFTANMMFFAVSGRFNLKEKNADSPGRFYLKKARGILVPIVLLFFVRTLFDLYPDYVSVGHVLKTYAKNFLGGYIGIEYWFMYTLVGLLLAVPLLARSLNADRPAAGRLMAILGVAFSGVAYVSANTGIQIGWGFLFPCTAVFFCLGPTIERLVPADGLRGRAVAGVALACAVANMLMVIRVGWHNDAFDASPLFMVSAACLYALLLEAGRRLRPGLLAQGVSFVARHSFTVYLVHMMVLQPLLDVLPAAAGAASLVEHLPLTLLTFMASLAVAVVLDAAVVGPFQRLFDRATARVVLREPR